jgi:uncharacterized protein YjgD (DUF1641 family)
MKIKNVEVEVMKDMENIRRRIKQKQKNTVEDHTSILEQVEDRLSELKDKIEIKETTEEILSKQLKTCKRNMQTPSKDQT